MKRAFYFLMLCGIVAASACKSEQLPDNPSVPDNDGRTRLTVTVEPTKASADGSGAFSWTVGDQISVYTTAGSFVTFTCDRVEAGRAAFSTEGNVTVDKVAVFPAGAHTLSGNALSVNLPSTYAWEEGQTFAPLVASFIEGAGEISFRHIGGVMQFTVTDLPITARQFVFRSADKQVSGSFTLSDYADESGTIAAGTATEGSTVTVTFDAPATTGTSKVFWIPLPTGTYNPFSVVLLDEAGNVVPHTAITARSSKNTIARRTVLQMPSIAGPKYVVSTVLGGPNVAHHNDGTASTAGVNTITGIGRASDGRIWFTDRNRLLRYADKDFNVKTTMENAGSNVLWGLAVNSKDEVYFAEKPNMQLYKSVAPYTEQKLIATLPHQAICVAFDAAGKTYVSCWDNNIYTVSDDDGTYTQFASMGGKPNGLAFNSKGNLIVTGSGFRNLKMVSPDGTVTIIAGKGGARVAKPTDGTPGNPLTADIGAAFGICVDENDYIWWIDHDYGQWRVLVPDADGDYTKGTVTTVAGALLSKSGAGAANFADGTGFDAKFAYTTQAIINAAATEAYVCDGAYNRALRKITVVR